MLKSEKLTIKILPTDKKLLQQIAAAEGESVASVVRRMIKNAARERAEQSREQTVQQEVLR